MSFRPSQRKIPWAQFLVGLHGLGLDFWALFSRFWISLSIRKSTLYCVIPKVGINKTKSLLDAIYIFFQIFWCLESSRCSRQPLLCHCHYHHMMYPIRHMMNPPIHHMMDRVHHMMYGVHHLMDLHCFIYCLESSRCSRQPLSTLVYLGLPWFVDLLSYTHSRDAIAYKII